MTARALALVTALAATPALAQQTEAPQRPSLWDMFSVERLATSLAHGLMGSARALADIRYDAISVDPVAARIDFIGLRIEPLLPGAPGPCRIDAAQATLRGAPLDRIEAGRFLLVLDDVAMAQGCLPPDMAPLGALTGPGPIRAARVEADLNYDYASGGADLRISADFERLAAVQFHADMDYVSYRMHPYRQEPSFAVDLNAAQLSLTDLGAWAIARNFLPPEMKTPEALSQTVTMGTLELLKELNGFISPEPSAEQRAFAKEVGALAGRFGDDAPRLVLATDIADRPLRLDDAAMGDFQALFARLAPTAGTSAPDLARLIPVAQLETTIGAKDAPENALETGLALISGVGAPRNVAEGLRLLEPLARTGNARAAAEIARALADRAPAEGYGYALRANAAGTSGMLALTNRIERDLPFEAMMSAQDAALGGATPDPALYRDPRAMRDAMRGFFTGTDRPRSYAAAYYWALIASAAGDASGVALRNDIAEMMRLRGDAARWQEVAARLENAALRQWIDSDVPRALRGTP